MASVKKKELRKKRLARKKAKEARLKDTKAIEAELSKSVEVFEATPHPLEPSENEGTNERKGDCQKKGYCQRKGCGCQLREFVLSEGLMTSWYTDQFDTTVPSEHQQVDKSFQQLLLQLSTLIIPRPKKNFTLFPKLPREIRNKIWAYVAGQSRRILIVRRDDYVHPDDRFRPPAIMSTCQESREEGKRHYTWGLDNAVYKILHGNKYFGIARGRL